MEGLGKTLRLFIFSLDFLMKIESILLSVHKNLKLSQGNGFGLS